MNKPKAKTAHVVHPNCATRSMIHIRMSDNSSRILDVNDRPSDKLLNGLIGLEDESLAKRFGPAFRGWRRKNG